MNPRLETASPTVALVDCGDGRRLDRFGPYVLDRPAPAVVRTAPRDPDAWRSADARFERGDRSSPARWEGPRRPTEPWTVRLDDLTFELRATDTGQVGLFFEHLRLWHSIRRHVEKAPGLRLLNLFAYTGGLTLSAAVAGAEVVHVDASRSAVGWARRNAELSGLADRTIRWIVEDADVFVRRELRRGNRYDAVVLDPPSYGHGPDGSSWRLDERLPDLLRACAALTGGIPALLLISAHTPGFDADRLAREVLEALGPEARAQGHVETGALELRAESGAILPAGAFARWTAGRQSVKPRPTQRPARTRRSPRTRPRRTPPKATPR